MKSHKYNLAYNTRDQLQSLAINAGERKQTIIQIPKLILPGRNRKT